MSGERKTMQRGDFILATSVEGGEELEDKRILYALDSSGPIHVHYAFARVPQGTGIDGVDGNESNFLVCLQTSVGGLDDEQTRTLGSLVDLMYSSPQFVSDIRDINPRDTTEISHDWRGIPRLDMFVATLESLPYHNVDDEELGRKPNGQVYIADVDPRDLTPGSYERQGEEFRVLASLMRADDPEIALLEALAESGSGKAVAIIRVLRAGRNIVGRKYGEARKEARRALENDPENVEGYLALANGFYGSRMDAHVKRTIEEGISKSDDERLYAFLNGKIINNYGAGVRSVKGSEYANGRKQLRRVVALQSGELNEATAEHTRALKAQFWIAESYFREGKQSDARVAFRKMLSLPEINDGGYNHAQVHYKLGLSLLEDGKEGAAKRAFRAAVTLDSEHKAKEYLVK